MAMATSRRGLSTLFFRSLNATSSTPSSLSTPSRSRFLYALLDKHLQLFPAGAAIPARFNSSGSGYSPLNDSSPNWSNRPPKETILLDGCDYEHWLIVMEFPTDPKPTEEEMINSYVKILAEVVGSEEEAKKKIYSVCTTTYTGFGALISEELSFKVKGLPGVLWVLPDSYLDVPNKDYGGDLFVDGKVIHRPQYWYDGRQQTRNRPRPRYDRRRETVQVQRRGEPAERLGWPQNQSTQQSSSSNQNESQVVGGAPPINQRGFDGNNS
ncbi:multiple organellar RNA editing factor 3, mitochondrial [Impatiens glandulifera]|uniref:multiple organellar RNA editing factor 3, mitochondrial n=1 Tax=Impatiens glandulifera TaxID=253017 RepID=UPI001FB15065|nr:multiple organellar RNA editing factor 3, mitochondrial [Impatiens glandulifera]